MSLILNIDTASEHAHTSIAADGHVLCALHNESQKDHAAFLQTAIEQLAISANIKLKDIDAVAVTAGPGSYTGLRVGMASAKGLCYALKIPLITIGTLEILALSALHQFADSNENILYCPMMDARRMEVFTAMYKHDLSICLQPCAMILDESSFEKELSEYKIMFFGSGSAKWDKLCKHENAMFKMVPVSPKSLSQSAYTRFLENNFTELAYSEPAYLKEFQSVIKN
jgi:tRNA threonylcarbamoyladenosine biosynthesis protein TsaB